ncbi:C-C motif chemokine 19-like [Brachyhypopomus gauderio]|uniref:C-C motif chemokine 19-like n=1 Tax=Brachyhypopomus gauderio TaxID=698409 RepID=UPI0040422180
MQTAGLMFLLFAAVFWCSTDGFTDQASDCCLTTAGSLVPRHIVKSYVRQNEDSACRVWATVFITKKNRKICSPPEDDKNFPWVKKLIAHLDKLAIRHASKQ